MLLAASLFTDVLYRASGVPAPPNWEAVPIAECGLDSLELLEVVVSCLDHIGSAVDPTDLAESGGDATLGDLFTALNVAAAQSVV